MFSHRGKETCGRHAPKPENKSTKDEVELFEEAEPIQQKIENLRTKIQLQERYNAALKDNLDEAATGSFTILRAMFADVHNLRVSLRDAVNKERWAVNNALRTHRFFQLALKRCTPIEAIDWMDDKLFDNTKLLNEHMDRLIKKRKKLEASEEAVSLLEKWPLPGSLPWEVEMEDKMKDMMVAHSNTKTKLECAQMLNVKYKAIRGRLRDERNLYQPILRNLNAQLSFQLNEVKNLEEMLGHALKFQKDAEKTLEWTEREASISRKLRRAQISRMRRELQRLVQQEQMSLQGKNDRNASEVRKSSFRGAELKLPTEGFLHNEVSLLVIDNEEGRLNERLAQKRAIIDTFNDNAAMLVGVMKIPNLTHIPQRMDDVINLTEILAAEKKSKEMLKNNLIRQRDQLMQLLCVIRYTGNSHVTQNDLIIQDYQKSLNALERKNANLQESLNQDSILMMDLQMGIASLMQRAEGLDRKTIHIRNSEHLMHILPVFYDKLENLTESLAQLKKEIPVHLQTSHHTKHQQRFAALTQQIPAKYMRVGDNEELEEASDEEEFEDFKVPGRLELKMRSEKIVEQGLLRMGITGKRRSTRPKLKTASLSQQSSQLVT